jgi:hypothetical protein
VTVGLIGLDAVCVEPTLEALAADGVGRLRCARCTDGVRERDAVEVEAADQSAAAILCREALSAALLEEDAELAVGVALAVLVSPALAGEVGAARPRRGTEHRRPAARAPRAGGDERESRIGASGDGAPQAGGRDASGERGGAPVSVSGFYIDLTGRKPKFMRRKSGRAQPRYGARVRQASDTQEPPRLTRSEPINGPPGSVTDPLG